MPVLETLQASALRLRKYLKEHPRLARIRQWSEQTKPPGFWGVPLYDVLVFLLIEIRKEAITVRANSLAFSFMLALFPTIIVLFTVLHYIPVDDFQNIMLKFFEEVLPLNAYNSVEETLKDVINRPRGGLLSTGFILAIFFSSNGMMSLMRAFNKSYHAASFGRRSAFQSRWVAIKLTLLLGIMLLLSATFVIAGNAVINVIFDLLQVKTFTYYAIITLKWIILISISYSIIAIIYRYGPATRRKFKFFTPGAIIATLLFIIISLGFSFFVNNFGTYNRLYGSIGTLIVIMLWLQINAVILLIGFELNASIAINRDLKQVNEAQ